MSIDLDLQIASTVQNLPTLDQFQTWVIAAIASGATTTISDHTELTIRLVDAAESATLNTQYRKKAGATNVLSFPADIDPQFNCPLLGDIIICAPVVIAEASTQSKELLAHWAHITIHGTLHLLGYNHIINQEAIIMEKLETEIIAYLGYAAPYGEVYL